MKKFRVKLISHIVFALMIGFTFGYSLNYFIKDNPTNLKMLLAFFSFIIYIAIISLYIYYLKLVDQILKDK